MTRPRKPPEGSGEGELSKADGVEIDVIEKSSGLRECLTDDDSFTGSKSFQSCDEVPDS